MTSEDRARRHLPALQRNLRSLVALTPRVFPVNIRRNSHLRFMLVSFAVKQNEHARSVLRLGSSLDTMLVARSMLEGLCQLLWALKQPRRRPLLWRSFAFVLDWRLLQAQRRAGQSADPSVERHARAGLRRYGLWFLTKEARQKRTAGQPLPADPYVRNWYGEREAEIFRDVGAHALLEHAYGPFSEWHHWRPGAIGRLVSFNEPTGRFAMTTSSPSSVATAAACAFQCLWQTMRRLNSRCRLGIGRDLQNLRSRQLRISKT